MEFPVVEYKGFLWLVLTIDGYDNIICIDKDGRMDSIGWASCHMPAKEALAKEGYTVVKYQTIKEFLSC